MLKKYVHKPRVVKTRTWNDDQLMMIGKYIQEKRVNKGITQYQLSNLIGMDKGRISFIEIGSYKGLDKSDLGKFAHHLSFNLEEILHAVDNYKREDTAIAISIERPSFSKRKVHREELIGENFTIQLDIKDNEFELKFLSTMPEKENEEVLPPSTPFVYQGKKIKNDSFVSALEELIRMLKKSL